MVSASSALRQLRQVQCAHPPIRLPPIRRHITNRFTYFFISPSRYQPVEAKDVQEIYNRYSSTVFCQSLKQRGKDPSWSCRYGAELHSVIMILDIPSYKKCHPIAILTNVITHLRTASRFFLASGFIIYSFINYHNCHLTKLANLPAMQYVCTGRETNAKFVQ